MDKRADTYSIRFLTTVVRAPLGSHVGKPSSAYGWSGGFPWVLLFSPTFDERLARYKWNILERAIKPKSKKKKNDHKWSFCYIFNTFLFMVIFLIIYTFVFFWYNISEVHLYTVVYLNCDIKRFLHMWILTLVLLNKLRCHTFFKFSTNQITWSRLLI